MAIGELCFVSEGDKQLFRKTMTSKRQGKDVEMFFMVHRF